MAANLTRANVIALINAQCPPNSMGPVDNAKLNSLLLAIVNADQSLDQADLTSTADGLTTGLITEVDQWINVTSASANNIITLPSLANVSNGTVFRGYVGANGFKLGTPAASNEKINNVDSDGTQLCAIPANSMWMAWKVDATQGWIVLDETRLGARTAAIVPA